MGFWFLKRVEWAVSKKRMSMSCELSSLPVRWLQLRVSQTWPCRWWSLHPRTISWLWLVQVWRCSSSWGSSVADSPSVSLRSWRTGRPRPPGRGVRTHPQVKRPRPETTSTTPSARQLHLPLQPSSPPRHRWNDITHNPTGESGLDQWLTCPSLTWAPPTSCSFFPPLLELQRRAPSPPAVLPSTHLI